MRDDPSVPGGPLAGYHVGVTAARHRKAVA